MEEETRQLYASILREIGPTPPSPPSPALHTLRFEDTLLRTVKLINRNHGWEYMTLRYEGQCRWTIMGHHPSDWMQFEYVDANRFRITQLISGPVWCLRSFRSGGVDMYSDIRDAMRFYGRDPEASSVGPLLSPRSTAHSAMSSPSQNPASTTPQQGSNPSMRTRAAVHAPLGCNVNT